MLLVSPGFFRDYGNAAKLPWANIQKRFPKVRLHRKTPDGFNIWNYSVIGNRRIRELAGILLGDPEHVFGPGVPYGHRIPMSFGCRKKGKGKWQQKGLLTGL